MIGFGTGTVSEIEASVTEKTLLEDHSIQWKPLQKKLYRYQYWANMRFLASDTENNVDYHHEW